MIYKVLYMDTVWMASVMTDKDPDCYDAVEVDTDGQSITIKRYITAEKLVFTIAEWKEVVDFINTELAEIDKAEENESTGL